MFYKLKCLHFYWFQTVKIKIFTKSLTIFQLHPYIFFTRTEQILILNFISPLQIDFFTIRNWLVNLHVNITSSILISVRFFLINIFFSKPRSYLLRIRTKIYLIGFCKMYPKDILWPFLILFWNDYIVLLKK